ncbi:uncharacterized protein EURHEDRAFT_488300 [Aspergillus ruber CBS 135680]|uniref:NAD(P)-binding protein n=1 Tax=Aspergillus ruber (strain CBS 135680) TaxID=1388766 RepID=A0A017S290_ASPRC|nr:NAD(P)-binding protein [Aspergillus ruber CBS 135680]EYE90759.1 NAD(P)-binding protein [Aspergillus ruber CBS 135680]
MAKIFLTGASGYIGGEVLHVLQTAYPEHEYVVMLRDKEKAQKVSNAYPKVRVVSGDLDSAALLEEEARKADIVIHLANAKHIESVEAIARGLTTPNRAKPGHWIQISGASLLSFPDIEQNTYGEPTDKVYNDFEGVEEVRQLIHRLSSKRLVDSFILNLAKSPTSPKTALVFPPLIYGRGRGPVNQRSVQVPELAKATLQRRAGLQVGKGKSIWSNVHITDISQIFAKLVEKALQGEEGELWNENGLYFAENGELTFKEISQLVTQESHKLGLVNSTSVAELTHQEADELSPHAGILWGTNAREQAQRARTLLDWVPKASALNKEIPEAIRVETERLGLKSIL